MTDDVVDYKTVNNFIVKKASTPKINPRKYNLSKKIYKDNE